MENKKLKKEILRNHREWLEGINDNIEDYPNSLDIAESANQADFRDTMFNNVNVQWIGDNVISIDGITVEAEFNANGFEANLYLNEDCDSSEDWYLELCEKYNIAISWAEFNEQVNKVQ